jgi:hypothetical protein
MEQLCRICSKYKPKAAFTEKSLSLHTCKACSKMPRPRTKERNQLDEIFAMLTQSRIFKKDTLRLEELAGSTIEKVALHASLLLEVAMVKPYKRGRNIFLEERYPELLSKMEQEGMIYPQP